MISVCLHSQDVIEVENTVSPKMLRGAPKERPANDWPVFRWRTAGGMVVEDDAWLAKPRERRAIRVKLRTNILSRLLLMAEERENEVAEVTVHECMSVRVARVLLEKAVNSLVASVLSENHQRAESLKISRGLGCSR